MEYGEYANAWRVTQANSLLDYSAGQTTATFTNLDFPAGAGVTATDLPKPLVAQAAQLAAAAGITDPNALAGAEIDYLATGDASFLTSAANAQQPGGTTTAANITVNAPAPVMVGVNAAQTSVVDPPPTDTTVTFPVYLTSATTTDTVLDWAVIAPNAGDLGAAAFGGALPSGQVTIPAGQTGAQFTVDVPGGRPRHSAERQRRSADHRAGRSRVRLDRGDHNRQRHTGSRGAGGCAARAADRCRNAHAERQ